MKIRVHIPEEAVKHAIKNIYIPKDLKKKVGRGHDKPRG